MKKALCIAAILALVTVASADVRAFVTGSSGAAGLQTLVTATKGTGNFAFQPTFATAYPNGSFSFAYDYYYHKVSAGPAIDAPSGTAVAPVLINKNAGEFGYIWFQFRDEPQGALVNGMQITVTNVATGLPAAGTFAYYKQDNRNAATSPNRRWDGTATPPGYAEWTNNPQTFVVVATSGGGVINEAAQAAPDNNWNLFTWQAGTVKGGPRTGVSLLGALDLPLGLYSIQFSGQTPVNYATGTNPALGAAGYFQVIPEPASMLLLSLAGLLIRRR
jgi:hypothetical protein